MEAVQRSLRVAVYDPSTSGVEDVVIRGDVELREAVGPHAHLLDPAAVRHPPPSAPIPSTP